MSVSAWPTYEQDEIDAVASVLRSGETNYWTGDIGKKFETEFAGHCNSKYAIALANGTLALELALEAAGIGPGDDVIVTPRSFIASASCAVRRGARPVFADVSLDSQNLTADTVAAALTPQTRAIIAVHHAGWPCDMDGLLALADQHDLVLIEDCAQAHGATYNDRPVGGLGHIAAFSFCQDKIMTTGGEGGMLVTNDETIWKKAWSIKDHGKNYDSVFNQTHAPGFRWLSDTCGTNMRMTEMQAAIGRIQLRKLPEWSKKRSDNAAQIARALKKFSAVTVPLPDDQIKHAFYRLYAFVDDALLAADWDRDRVMRDISSRGVPCFSGTCPAIYDEKAFAADGLRPEKALPGAAELGPKSLAFLVHPTLTADDMKLTCNTIDAVMSEAMPR